MGGCPTGPLLFAFWAALDGQKESTQSLVILKKQVAGLTASALSRFVTRACRSTRLRGGVNVLVTTNHKMRALNGRFRKKDIATDVLSFPAAPNPGTEMAGDIAISAEIAVRNAKRSGHSEVQEIKILALHGILHLAGFDHERDNGEMAREEARLRSTLGLPTGLIERQLGKRPSKAFSGKGSRKVRARRKNASGENRRTSRKLG
jgi:probable rRNA maturation factor